MELLAKVDELGGAAKAISASFFQEEIARSAYEHQMRVERGESIVVGVNKYSDGKEPPLIPAPDYSALEKGQVAQLGTLRAARDGNRVKSALTAIGEASRGKNPELMPLIIEAVRARASVGEIADALRQTWGEYRP